MGSEMCIRDRAIEGVCGRHGMRLDGIKILRERYGMKYVWKKQCKALVERLSGMISADQGIVF